MVYDTEGYRQGDVNLHKIDKLPTGAERCKDNILAHGEVTGHRHFLDTDSPCQFEKDGQRYVVVGQETVLVHNVEGQNAVTDLETARREDKHLALKIRPGVYAVTIETEENPFLDEIKQVMD